MIDLVASSQLMRMVILMGVFALVMLLSLLISMAVARQARVRRSLRGLAGFESDVGEASLSTRNRDAWTRLVARIERAGISLSDTREDSLRQTLKAAGYTSPAAPRLYSLLRLLLVVGLPLVFVTLVVAHGRQVSPVGLYLLGCFWAGVGLYLPMLHVRLRAERRREAIINGFPDCLDLMLICVESGYGMEAALDRVAREMAVSHPQVARLLTEATLRQRAGASREAALRLLAEDADVDEVRSFATLMIQSDKLGTSIATTLRVYAAEMRERRRMRAEEKAHRIPVLISIPLVTCMLPVMIGVLMLPAVIVTIRKLIPAMLGAGA
ncbi:type II secretion system F family protein [Novosphingobium rosa]|uniref:type II secretion system F family protein n=1 Tax=Novosphingobium rosa TaxID=76978 RepID=UPI00082AC4DF|nr:type II secretion system F family protein [Novosphingobium rosa]